MSKDKCPSRLDAVSETAMLKAANDEMQTQLAAATERAEKAERERDEAQAACAAMRRLVMSLKWIAQAKEPSQALGEYRWTRHAKNCRKALSTNPGQPILDANAKLEKDNADLRAVLSELLALVRGECPSLLDEDSGGCARLDTAADAMIAEKRRREAGK